jgi:hypothetical protein
MENQDIGEAVLSGILFRMQSIKLARLIETRKQGRGGGEWYKSFQKTVFQKQTGMDQLAKRELSARWKDKATIKKFEDYQKENRWLVVSRNRLLQLYDIVSERGFLL